MIPIVVPDDVNTVYRRIIALTSNLRGRASILKSALDSGNSTTALDWVNFRAQMRAAWVQYDSDKAFTGLNTEAGYDMVSAISAVQAEMNTISDLIRDNMPSDNAALGSRRFYVIQEDGANNQKYITFTSAQVIGTGILTALNNLITAIDA